MSKTFFISFSGSVGEQNNDLTARQNLLNKSAIEFSGADEEIAWTRSDLLQTDFYKQNKWILDQSRGAGFWAWKPYVILQTLNKVTADDWVIYSDIGKPFRRGDPSRSGNNKIGNIMNTRFDSLIEFAKTQNGFTPGIWVPHYGNARTWTKRDCFVGMGCDTKKYHNSGQVQAGYSCWSNTKESRDFLKQWLHWCQIQAVVSDNVNIYGKPNFPEFRDHRHDQSIVTNLVIKNNITLFGSKDKSLDGYRDFNLIIRYMALNTSLKNEVSRFETLFNTEKPLLPHYLNKALQLWLLPELTQKSMIKVCSRKNINRWQYAFKNHEVEFDETISSQSKKYTAVFINDCKDSENLESQLVNGYESLVPGGTLVMGPFKGKKVKVGKLNGSFSELVQWIFINQQFPQHLSNAQNQTRNAITLGNANNPYIINVDEHKNYIILRKPLMNVSVC